MNVTAFPDVILERFLLGELSMEKRDAVQARLEHDAGLRARLEELRLSNDRVLAHYPVENFLLGFRNRERRAAEASASAAYSYSPARSFRLPALRKPFPALGALAALVFAVGFAWVTYTLPKSRTAGNRAGAADGAVAYAQGGHATGSTPTEADGIRLKGRDAGLWVFRKTAAGNELLSLGASARPGDTLQVFYQSAKAFYGMVFSVDGARALTLHLPEEPGQAVRLETGAMRPMPHAYLLDQAPNLERFYLITSAEPFSTALVLAAARKILERPMGEGAATLPLPEGFNQYFFTLHKENPSGEAADEKGGI